MPIEISKFVNSCKDFLHAEWTVYKKQGFIKPCPVCIYSIGSEDTIPVACIESVGNGFIEIERALREHFYLAVDMNSPIVSQDVMVWADGQITLFPPRKQKPVEEPVPSTAKEPKSLLPPGPPGGRKPRPPPTPRAAFMSAIEQIANYMIDHLKRVSESCLLAGNIKILYYVLSSATLIKCRIMTYKNVMRTPLSKSLSTAVTRCNEMIEVITQHILNYHSDLIRSSIVHDAPSTDWTCVRAYEEDERISVCIQMWSFYMQGIRNDLWRSTSTKVGETILNNILVDTLSLFVHTRSSAPSPRHFFRGDIHDSVVFPIHRRMDLLLRVAALKCAPVETISKVYSSGIRLSKSCCVNSKEPTEIVSCPSWLTFLNRRLFPPDTRQLSSLPDEVAVYLTLHNAALRPYPNQGLILRIFHGKLPKGGPCGGALCLGHLCTPPLIPHTVYSAAVQILISSYSSTHILSDIIQASIKDSGNWDSLDRMHVWNIQRPPWHHAFVQLIAVHITPVVAKVLEVLPAEPPAQPAHPSQLSIRLEHHLSAWTLQLIKGVGEMGDAIPRSLVYISETVNGMLPPTIKPVGGHVISQFVISAIYSIINSRSSLDQLSSTGFITDGQWDMMIAVGERLCSLHDGNYNDALEKMTSALLQQLTVETETDDENLDDYTNEDVIEEVCQEMA
ncbi:Uncharacterized protein Anas_11168 [Armadillidium nasatum]|uniref:Uncharacterized protein n=1 Tax=Armadillidium nasatum TaxID=96803 RepID=A0A5N5SW28_9CRUS|nr:Uncharacterized protein Anas_11168 [Armadillidium nasatum]